MKRVSKLLLYFYDHETDDTPLRESSSISDGVNLELIELKLLRAAARLGLLWPETLGLGVRADPDPLRRFLRYRTVRTTMTSRLRADIAMAAVGEKKHTLKHSINVMPI